MYEPCSSPHPGRSAIRAQSFAPVVYRIDESKHSVVVEDIQHRATACRRR
jgi:hypothetical protein